MELKLHNRSFFLKVCIEDLIRDVKLGNREITAQGKCANPGLFLIGFGQILVNGHSHGRSSIGWCCNIYG
jgi:hypothetical protein